MRNNIYTISVLPDLAMPKYAARYEGAAEVQASQVLSNVLGLLRPGQGEWVGLRYLYTPNEAAPQERLRLFVKVYATDIGADAQDQFPGKHMLLEFYKLEQSSANDAFATFRNRDCLLYTLCKKEEAFDDKPKNQFYYAPRPFQAGQLVEGHSLLLDALFHSLRSPCLVNIVLGPTEVSEGEAKTLTEEIKHLDRLASAFDPERRDKGSLADLARDRDLLAARHREYYQQYLDTMFESPVFEYDLQIVSTDPHEGYLVAQSFGNWLVSDGNIVVRQVRQGGADLQNIKRYEYPNNARENRHFHEAFSERAKYFPRARVLSRFSRLVDREMASAMLHLPTSNGIYLRTIRIESEFHGVDREAATAEKAIAVGPEQERIGAATFSLELLKKHMLLTGCTGSGKTYSMLNILLQLYEQHGIPFLLLMPITDPYRMLLRSTDALGRHLRIYSPGKDSLSPFRFNPFEVPAGLPIEVHIAALETCFAGAFELWGPLPALLDKGIIESYRAKGFRTTDVIGQPTDRSARQPEWPRMRDVVQAVRSIMDKAGYEGEIKGNLQAALEVRLESLCHGSVGRMFSSDRTLPSIESLQGSPAIIEMDYLNQNQQNLLSLFLMNAIRERLNLAGPSPHLKHLIVLEESHNLIGVQSVGKQTAEVSDPRGEAARFLVKCLAETRDLGQGYAIIDQSPSAIAPDVLRNTTIKIVHRTVDQQDRDTLASAMLLDRCAKEDVARLRPGDLYIYHENLYRPIRAHSHSPFAEMERPSENEVFAIIRTRQWFLDACDVREKALRKTLDQILADLKKFMVGLIKTIRKKPTASAAEYLRHAEENVNLTESHIEDVLGAAALDGGLHGKVGQLKPIYLERLHQLTEAFQDQLNREIPRSEKGQ